MFHQAISIVIPVFNEINNLPKLFERIDNSCRQANLKYEIILIDDHSTDGSLEFASQAAAKFPLKIFLKKGKQGKAYSLLEGFHYAAYDLVGMIDADLQYPPEALVAMYKLLVNHQADIVLSERISSDSPLIRRLSTKIFNLIFIRLLFGINYDTQSGLKVFRKQILSSMSLSPSPWSFDLEFIIRALEEQYKIINYKISFSKRHAGQTKVKLLSTSLELAKSSLKLYRDAQIKNVKLSYKKNLEFTRGSLMGIGAIISGLIVIGSLTVGLPKNVVYADDFSSSSHSTGHNKSISTSSLSSKKLSSSTSSSNNRNLPNTTNSRSTSSKQLNSTNSNDNSTPNNVTSTHSTSTPSNNTSNNSSTSTSTTSTSTNMTTNQASIPTNKSLSSSSSSSSGLYPYAAAAAPSPTIVANALSSFIKPSLSHQLTPSNNSIYNNHKLSAKNQHILSNAAMQSLQVGLALVFIGMILGLIRRYRNHIKPSSGATSHGKNDLPMTEINNANAIKRPYAQGV